MSTQTRLLILILCIGTALVFFGTRGIYWAAYGFTLAALGTKTLFSGHYATRKGAALALYLLVFALQIVFCDGVVFTPPLHGPYFVFKKLMGVALIYAPFLVNTYLNYRRSVFPSVEEVYTVSFHALALGAARAGKMRDGLRKVTHSFRLENVAEFLEDLPRHGITNYVNRRGLTEQYFADCEETLEDPHVYLVLSDTGSPASEMLSVFTRRMYNHISLSFDRELRTIVSYNGGEKIYPPGMNREQISFFHKKKGASLLVYRLPCTRGQKTRMLERVREINATGSAYNMVGLLTRASFRPNIMFCSQFVYRLLAEAGIGYFQSRAIDVRPTDFVEKDYRRKLEYCYQIRFDTGAAG